MYDRADATVSALATSWGLNLGSLAECNVDKQKLRQWKAEQTQIFEKQGK